MQGALVPLRGVHSAYPQLEATQVHNLLIQENRMAEQPE